MMSVNEYMHIGAFILKFHIILCIHLLVFSIIKRPAIKIFTKIVNVKIIE